MRASRLLSILLLLQNRGRMTAEELAGELEVSVRTVYRDIDALGGAGVPLYADRGPAGGYRLVEGYRTRLTGLNSDEASALFLAGLPGPAAELGLGAVVAAAQLKLLAALPEELRTRAAEIRNRFHLDAPEWFREGDQPPHLPAVADAVWNGLVVRARYRRWTGEVARTLEPLGLVLKSGAWYLVARVEGDVRTYRVARLMELEVPGERFERPEGFDLAAYWRDWSEQFQANLHRAEAIVRLSPRAFDLLPALFDPLAARKAASSASVEDEEGWRQVTLPIESVERALIDLLRLGAEVEIVAPEELRRRMVETIAAMARRYQR